MLQEEPESRDDITGIPLDDLQNKEDNDQIVKVLQQGEAFRDLVKTPGWALVNDFVSSQVEMMTQLLKTEKNFDKIVRIQSELLAFESLILIIEKSFIDYEEATRRVKSFINEDPKG